MIVIINLISNIDAIIFFIHIIILKHIFMIDIILGIILRLKINYIMNDILIIINIDISDKE